MMSLTPGMKHQTSSSQEDFWKNKITESYARDNSVFDKQLGMSAWEIILSKIDKSNISSYLDCGSNIGRNIAFLNFLKENHFIINFFSKVISVFFFFKCFQSQSSSFKESDHLFSNNQFLIFLQLCTVNLFLILLL
jgi:hypothetical protein